MVTHEDPLKAMAKDLGVRISCGSPSTQGRGQAGLRPRHLPRRVTWAMGAILLDPTGEVGRKYGAVKTPQVYLIDAEGPCATRVASTTRRRTRGEAALQQLSRRAVSSLRASKRIDPSETKPTAAA